MPKDDPATPARSRSGGEKIPLSMRQFAPRTMNLILALMVLPIPVSVIFGVLYVFAPAKIGSLAESLWSSSRRIVSVLSGPNIPVSDGATGRFSISPAQRAMTDVVVAIDVSSLMVLLVVGVAITVLYRRHIAAWLRYRFNQTTEEYLRSLAPTQMVMAIIAIASMLDLKWGGATLRLIEMRFDGSIATFPLFLFRVGAWFFLLNTMTHVGLQAPLFWLLGRERKKAS
jgi:hypothetical protein